MPVKFGEAKRYMGLSGDDKTNSKDDLQKEWDNERLKTQTGQRPGQQTGRMPVPGRISPLDESLYPTYGLPGQSQIGGTPGQPSEPEELFNPTPPSTQPPPGYMWKATSASDRSEDEISKRRIKYWTYAAYPTDPRLQPPVKPKLGSMKVGSPDGTEIWTVGTADGEPIMDEYGNYARVYQRTPVPEPKLTPFQQAQVKRQEQQDIEEKNRNTRREVLDEQKTRLEQIAAATRQRLAEDELAFQKGEYVDKKARQSTLDSLALAEKEQERIKAEQDKITKEQERVAREEPWDRFISGLKAGKLNPEYALPQAFQAWLGVKGKEMAESPFWNMPGGPTAIINKARLEGNIVPGEQGAFIDVPTRLLPGSPLEPYAGMRVFAGTPGYAVATAGQNLTPTLPPLSEFAQQQLVPKTASPWEEAAARDKQRAWLQHNASATGTGPTVRASAFLREQKESGGWDWENKSSPLYTEYNRRMAAAREEEETSRLKSEQTAREKLVPGGRLKYPSRYRPFVQR